MEPAPRSIHACETPFAILSDAHHACLARLWLGLILDGVRAAPGGGGSSGSSSGLKRPTLTLTLTPTHMQPLDELAARHFRATQAAAISVSGRHLPLLYTLVGALASPPHCYAVLVVDLDGRFDATRLPCGLDHLRHVYVHRPARCSPDGLRALVAEADDFMLHADAARPSAARPWWGTVVVGGLGAGDLVAGWKGWLRVDRQHVGAFALGISADEALAQRAQRQEAVDAAPWAATSQWGGFVFGDG